MSSDIMPPHVSSLTKKPSLFSSVLGPPVVDIQSSPDSFMVELIVYNQYPNKNHWAFFVQSHMDPDIGAVVHATGSARNGFKFEIKRYYDFKRSTSDGKRIPLQLIDGINIDEKAMLNNEKYTLDSTPVCKFEMSVSKVAPPEKDQRIVDSSSLPYKTTPQKKNCQTWIIESANQLVMDGIFKQGVVNHLNNIKQE